MCDHSGRLFLMQHNLYREVFVDCSHSCACFSRRLMYMCCVFASQRRFGGHHTKITCKRKSLKETSVELPLSCQSCISFRSRFTSLPENLCSCKTNKEDTKKANKGSHGLGAMDLVKRSLCRLWSRSEPQILLVCGSGEVPKLNSETSFSPCG